jgi:5-oxoprolinase (ATP-hydrolysing)
VIDNTQTIVIVPGAEAKILSSHVVIEMPSAPLKDYNDAEANVIDPIKLSVFSHRFMSIAEQMGLTLQKTSISLNIKERLDFSCAVFGPEGDLVANAPRMTVPLVSSPALTYR